MFRVIGRTLPAPVPATLHNFRKWETSLGYPVILPEQGASVSGVVWFSINHQDLKRLDEYEDVDGNPPSYFRRLMQVQGAHGSISAYVYVGNLNFFRTRLRKPV